MRTSPDFLLMQEVTMPMYTEIQRILTTWKVKKRHDQKEEYFNVTATKWPGSAADRSTSYAFPKSHNGRHTLTVRRGELAVVNVHAESGSRSVDCDARAEQLRYMSRSHERDDTKVHLLVGDLNIRPGEEQCLLSEGWRDAWSTYARSSNSDDWTWRAGRHSFRFDRVLHHPGHHRLHARNRGSQHREPLIHAHGHRHAGIAQRTHRKTQVFLQQLQSIESKEHSHVVAKCCRS